MAEGTHSTTLKVHHESSQRQHKAIQRQLDNQRKSIQTITNKLDQMNDMICPLVEHHRVNPSGEGIQEQWVEIQEDRNVLVRGYN